MGSMETAACARRRTAAIAAARAARKYGVAKSPGHHSGQFDDRS
jgi:hypothetical protein